MKVKKKSKHPYAYIENEEGERFDGLFNPWPYSFGYYPSEMEDVETEIPEWLTPEERKHYEEYATEVNLKVGQALVVSPVSDVWGVGIILTINLREKTCLIYWQKIEATKWHSLYTILKYLKNDLPELSYIIND